MAPYMVVEMLQKLKFLFYVLYLCHMKFYCYHKFNIDAMFYHIIRYLYVCYMFFCFGYTFLFSYYLILNLYPGL